MRISLLEPIGVGEEIIQELSEPIRRSGHEFIYYPEKTTDPDELLRRSAGCEVVTIANNPFPDRVVAACDGLKMINVAFTGIDMWGWRRAVPGTSWSATRPTTPTKPWLSWSSA